MAKKQTVAQKVAEATDELHTLDLSGLYQWATTHGLDSQAGFAAFKKALLTIGIDYNAMRALGRAVLQEAMEAEASATVTLYSDAKASRSRFGITDADGNPVWFGRFFDNDADFNGEQSSGELAAAKKAVWLAGKVREAIGAGAIKLVLYVDAEWLLYANAVAAGNEGGGKARALGLLAQRYHVVLDVRHVAGIDNPADKYTVCDGFQRWRDADLRALAKESEPEQPQTAAA